MIDLLNKISREIDETSLIAFDLFELDIDFNEYFDESNKLIRKQLKLTSFQNDVDDVWNKFNFDQRHAVDFIVNNVHDNQFDTKQFYFLNDFEDTNKIFVQNIVLNKLRFENFIIFVVASFDIAIILLNKNQIVHFQFKISLNFDENSFCNISKNTKLIELIQRTKLIFWNEFFMQRKFDMLVVNRIIFDLCFEMNEFISFDDKIVCFCENFKQCTFVCSNVKKNIIMNINLKTTSFWFEITIFSLSINIKFQNFFLNVKNKTVAAQFANKILIIDNEITIENFIHDEFENKTLWSHKYIENNDQLSFIKTIYSNFMTTVSIAQYLKNRVILVIANVNVQLFNKICMNKLLSNVYYKYNSNEIKNKTNHETYFSKCFHHYDETSLFFHLLSLKMNMLVMIFRNIQSFVMCNDIRVRILIVDNNVLKTKIIADKHADYKIFISRISLNCKNDDVNKNKKKTILISFIKVQYFIRSAFVIIINKFQSQSLRHVDINIQTRECFSHDQLYVVIFKMTKKCNFHAITFEHDFVEQIKWIRNIVWKKMLLKRDEVDWIEIRKFLQRCWI